MYYVRALSTILAVAKQSSLPKIAQLKGALSWQFCYILVKTAQIFDKEPVF